MTLSIIELRSGGWSTVRALNIGYFGVFLGSQKGVSGLFNGSLGLSVTVGLRACLVSDRVGCGEDKSAPPTRRNSTLRVVFIGQLS